jgi:CheY-like chemotaxis protein
MDVMMPGMNGLEATMKIKDILGSNSDVRIVGLSAMTA